MNKKIRQYLGLLSAVLVYYLVHEGAHLVYALSIGVFRQINFMGVGIQVDVYAQQMSNLQKLWECFSRLAVWTAVRK